MFNKLTHFAIYVEDIDRASTFYNEVFNWKFNQSDQPDFLQITEPDTTEEKPIGALQHRKYSVASEKVIGLECTFTVEDIEAVVRKIKDAGGEILMPKTDIPKVGWITKFKDTEENIVCAMQYLDHIQATMNS
ncbi:MAG: VOC family protein [Balneolaceae bacterium]|nr:VOC family protein [Balneolaceae bacterium]